MAKQIQKSRNTILNNKKGDFQSLVYLVVAVFIAGILMFFFSHFNSALLSAVNSEINNTYQNTTALTALDKIQTWNSNIWDWAFLLLFIGHIMALCATAWFVRISPVFFWVFVFAALFCMVLGVLVSNVWQDMTMDIAFAETLSQFPKTNWILGSKFALIEAAIIAISLIFLFSKPPEGI